MVAMRCSTCGGDAGGHETCDLCAERELGRREKQRSEQLAWLYTCAHRALKLARTYGVADGKDGLRARGCLAQVKVYRKDIRGLRDVQGRGVLYGASRNEASNVVGKRVFLVGGGNSAGQAAVFFANYAAEVTILVRGKGLELTMSQYLIEQIDAKKNVHVEPFTEVLRADGDDHLERIDTRTRFASGKEVVQTRAADALFVMIGADASTAWLPKELERDAAGYICTGRDLNTWTLKRAPFPLETNLPGVFCAGDVRHDSIKRVSSGVGEGSMAIAFIHQYLALKNF